MAVRFETLIIIIELVKVASPRISGHIFGGEDSQITDFPHSAHLSIGCNSDIGEGFFSCGSSIVNQAILLTAGHCVFGCMTFSYATAAVGHEKRDEGSVIEVSSFRVHEDFVEGLLSNDIALVLLEKDLEFNERVSRVVLMKEPPDVGAAIIAGWGRINEQMLEVSPTLKHSKQQVMAKQTCIFILNNPHGTICAESSESSVPSEADSGSALVVLRFIQIGLVSYTNPKISQKTTVYTDVAYFFDWIKENSKIMYCQKEKERQRYEFWI